MSDPKIVGSVAYKTFIKGGKEQADSHSPYMAHIDTWYEILNKGAPAAFVFNKDTKVPSDFYQQADFLFANSGGLRDYESFDLWLFNERKDILKMEFSPVTQSALVLTFQGMYGYMITRRGILRLLPHLFPSGKKLSQVISSATGSYEIDIVYMPSLTVKAPKHVEEFTWDKYYQLDSTTILQGVVCFILIMAVVVLAKVRRWGS